MQHIPVLGDLAIGDPEDIDSNRRFWSPSEVATVNHDIGALGHNKTWLKLEISRKLSQERLNRSGAVRNLWVVLPIVVAEQPVENRGSAIDENPLDPRKNQRFVGVRSTGFLSAHRRTSKSMASS